MKRSVLGFGPLLVIVACLVGLWTVAPDLVYAVAGPPQDLGNPPQASLLRSNLHATVHGQVQLSGTATYRGEERPLVLLSEAPVAVLQKPGTPPSSAPIDATGRLLRADRMAGPLGGNPWATVASRKNLTPDKLFVLVEGLEPGPPWRSLAWGGVFLAMLIFNLWRLLALRRPLEKAST